MGHMEVVLLKTTYLFPEPVNATWIGSKDPRYTENYGVIEETQIFFYDGEIVEISYGFDVINHVGFKTPIHISISPLSDLQIYERLIRLAISVQESHFPFSEKKAN